VPAIKPRLPLKRWWLTQTSMDIAQDEALLDFMVKSGGISVMAGFIAGLDGDTPESIVVMADRLYEIGVDVPFLKGATQS
jgi:uncharacterized protein YneR